VDLGQPGRVLNVLLYPSPRSVMFWDLVSLSGYLVLNLVIGWFTLEAERLGTPPPGWLKPVVYVSIPWAVSIHTVTAFLYAGLPARHLWLTAILAARFLASAFCAGPALLILLCLAVRRYSRFDPGREAIQTLAKIVTYAMVLNVFFLLLEVFTAFYSRIPGHMQPFTYLYAGLAEQGQVFGRLVGWMWVSASLAAVSLVLLLFPRARRREGVLACAVLGVFFSTWIDKGLGLVVGGFIPNPFDTVTEYLPTAPEVGVAVGVWAAGFLILVVLFKIAVSVKEEVGQL
jgi:molybdopterin-containing oxidoreductase family membrane subunit